MKELLARNRQMVLRGLGTLAAVVLIGILIREEGWAEVLAAFKSLPLSRVLIALAFILVSRLFVVTRWYVLLRSGGVAISYPRAFALTFTGLFSSNFLPTTIGGDVVRLAGAMQLGYDRAVSLASIAADRLIGMLGMVFALPFGLPQALSTIGQGAAQSIAIPAFAQRLWDFAMRTLRTFAVWLNQPLALLTALACTWAHMLCTFAALSVLIDGLGGHVNFWLIGGLWSVTYFVTLVPISINGYGVQELSLTYLLSSVGGLGTTLSLTVAVMIRVLYMLASLPGAASMPGILAAMDKGDPKGQP
ncbi:MAG TPA: lysylphosphatidylglycerol synthase transmembrane domain-containing protein [Anaerolineales bacterium]